MTQELNKIVITVNETLDDFIFTTVSEWCGEKTEMKISKRILKQALIEYRQNHPEEFEEK